MKTPVNTEKHSKTPTALIAVLSHATPTVTWLFTFGFRGVPGDHACVGKYGTGAKGMRVDERG